MTITNTNTLISHKNQMYRFVFLSLLFSFVFVTLGCEPAEELDEYGNETGALAPDEVQEQDTPCFDRKLSTGSSDFCKPEMFWEAYAEQTCFVADRKVANLRLVGKCKNGWYWSAQVTCCTPPTTALRPLRPKRLHTDDIDATDESQRSDEWQRSSNLEDFFMQTGGGPNALPDNLCSVIAGTGPYGVCKDSGCKRRGGKCKAKDIDDDGYYDECNCIAVKKPKISSTDVENRHRADHAEDAADDGDQDLDTMESQEADARLRKARLIELWPVPERDSVDHDRALRFAGRLISDDADLSASDLLELADRICAKNGLLHIAFRDKGADHALDFLCATKPHRLTTQSH
ncbi:MAG: hypothetical protein CMH54_01250 [Myxococcales bacterium]|nr:hypothetical protein [Myxococcales bacterium]